MSERWVASILGGCQFRERVKARSRRLLQMEIRGKKYSHLNYLRFEVVSTALSKKFFQTFSLRFSYGAHVSIHAKKKL